MAKKFSELEAKMSPGARGRAKMLAKSMMSEMLLAEVRQTVGLTQEQLAAALDVKQPTLSRMESQSDMQISTLRRLVRALGGEVDIVIRLPNGAIRLTQFDDAA